MVVCRWLSFFISTLFLHFSFAQTFSPKIWTQEAQAGSDAVDVYSEANFDSEVVTTIKPGKFYWITSKPDGPFYKILIGPNRVGYVPDTELDIKGRGPFQPKTYLGDNDDEQPKSLKKQSTKKNQRLEKHDEDDDDTLGKNHLVALNLVNYHEDTLGGVQVGDLWAIEYKNLSWGADEADYGMGGLGWNVMAAFAAPDYYKKKTGRDASGKILWGGVQFQNYALGGSASQIRYGIGPFLKYSHFEVETSLKKYTLQDATVGITLEGAFQYLWTSFGVDIGLRYYWDKNPYGVLSLGILF